MQPVAIFECHSGAEDLVRLLARCTSISGSFEIVAHVNVLLGIEYVAHDNEVDSLNPGRPRELDLVQTIEASDEGMWIRQHMVVIVLHDGFEVIKLIV